MEHRGNSFDVLVIGAGPTGMASAIEAQRAGFRVALVDKGCLVNSLFHYPANMVFFTTPELLEIGDIPFTSATSMNTARERSSRPPAIMTCRTTWAFPAKSWPKCCTITANRIRISIWTC
jgi:thioredoxin reductase